MRAGSNCVNGTCGGRPRRLRTDGEKPPSAASQACKNPVCAEAAPLADRAGRRVCVARLAVALLHECFRIPSLNNERR